MMEGMTLSNQEGYIWAMRVHAYRESDSEIWKNNPDEELSKSSLIRKRSKGKGKRFSASMIVDRIIKDLTTLVPDEIIYNPNECDPKVFEACFLFLRYHGFTELADKHITKGGSSKVAKVLNDYIGVMIQEIISHNGDVIKFSSNSVLVMWKCFYGQPMQECVHQALDCAVLIQKHYAELVTDVGSVLSVSMSIAAGEAIFAILGNSYSSYHIVVGQALWQAKKSFGNLKPGEVFVSPNAWHFINPSEYSYEYTNDGLHVKIHGVGPNWRSTQKSQFNRGKRHAKQKDTVETNEEEKQSDISSSDDDSNNVNEEVEEYLIRPAMNNHNLAKITNDLRKFILGPVLNGIDMEEPLDYLTEIRKVVILYCNVQYDHISDIESIKIINEIYAIIYEIINKNKGCINEIQVYEGNVTFKIIFGLPGYKQDLESQVGILCAKNIYTRIRNETTIANTVSIGISTGMSYCGVVGHMVRREYIVISGKTKEAGLMMLKYPNKITCDRETFVHSKLESNYFILEEPLPLSATEIEKSGTIYVFNDEHRLDNLQMNIGEYPALGREDEITYYIYLLKTFLYFARLRIRGVIDRKIPRYKSCLIIEGHIRCGKTNLLNEMVYFTPKHFPVFRVHFDKYEHAMRKPYDGIRKILNPFLSFNQHTSESQREAALMKRLSLMKVPTLLCALNNIFQVNFPMKYQYTNLKEEERFIVQQKMIKQLFFGCFPSPWVIAIDNGTIMDDISWLLLKEVLNMDIVFFVFTINLGSQHINSAAIQTMKCHPRVHTLNMTPIEKWYHAGLACQILNVQAIPIELETAIQNKSNGNPGYIESCLISLVQAGGLVYRTIAKHLAYELCLVEPPPDMLSRKYDNEKFQNMENNTNKMSTYSEFSKTPNVVGWNMFRSCYKTESATSYDSERDRIQVVFVTSVFSLYQISGEYAIDVLTLRTIDSLTSFERNIIKCGSVLGLQFTRMMLYYVMNVADIEKTASAIKKLFEMRILACAQGDFTPGERNTMDCFLIFKNRLKDPTKITNIKCYCRGIYLPDCLENYPKYSYCGYMRFVLPSFKETAHSMLIEKQRIEINSKAVRYLEKEIRRCKPCGGGFFVKFMGKRHDDGLKTKEFKEKKEKTTKTASTISDSIHTTSIRSSGIDMRSGKSTDAITLTFDTRNVMKRNPSECFVMPKCTYPKKIRRIQEKYSITRTFSGSDFSSCYCFQILDTMYTKMLKYAYESDLSNKIIDALLEYAYVCIVSKNIPSAIIILNDAYHKLNDENIREPEEEEWKTRLLIAKIKTLEGYSRHKFGQPEEAYKLFHQAMKFYGNPFPTTFGAILWKTKYMKFKQKIALYYIPKFLQRSMRDYQLEYCENLSECLGFMFELFRERQLWVPAALAATWSLNRALMSNMDFYRLAISYTNMLEVELQNGNHKKCLILEVHALQLCHRKKTSIEDCELKAVTNMYTLIFIARVARSENDRAISLGYTTLHICGTVSSTTQTLLLLPLFIYVLIIKRRLSEAITLLYELEFYAEEDMDSSGKTWFFGLGLSIQVFTGYTMLSYNYCQAYSRAEGENFNNFRDPTSQYNYFTMLWLWCVRNENWEQASVWYFKTYNTRLLEKETNLLSIMVCLNVLEGLLIYLVLRMHPKNARGLQQMHAEINLIFTNLRKKLKYSPMIRPRYFLYKSYYKTIRSGAYNNRAVKLLNKAREAAIANSNFYILGWIEFTERAWTLQLSRIQREFWKNHCDGENQIDIRDLDDEDPDMKLGYYTLPTPFRPLD